MGGGRLHIQFDIPLISAYFDAFLDVFIAFKPFHYIADMGVDVGVVRSIASHVIEGLLINHSPSILIAGSSISIYPPTSVPISILKVQNLEVPLTLIYGFM